MCKEDAGKVEKFLYSFKMRSIPTHPPQVSETVIWGEDSHSRVLRSTGAIKQHLCITCLSYSHQATSCNFFTPQLTALTMYCLNHLDHINQEVFLDTTAVWVQTGREAYVTSYEDKEVGGQVDYLL